MQELGAKSDCLEFSGGKPPWSVENTLMKPLLVRWAGICCFLGALLFAWSTYRGDLVFQGQDWWPPILAAWMGCVLMIRSTAANDKFHATQEGYLRFCYLTKALIWAIPFVAQPSYADWYYWSPLIPNAYFCGDSDFFTIPVWCTFENVALAFFAPTMLARGSKIPFPLACLSGLHALAVHNPLVLGTAAYLLIQTGPWSNFSRALASEADGVGFSPAD